MFSDICEGDRGKRRMHVKKGNLRYRRREKHKETERKVRWEDGKTSCAGQAKGGLPHVAS